jgi:hypothetical protein
MIDHTGEIWDVETTDTDGESIYIVSDLCAMNDDAIAKVGTLIDAMHIVKCVNAHDELVAALKSCRDRIGVLIECDNEDHGGANPDDIQAWESARVALAKVQA